MGNNSAAGRGTRSDKYALFMNVPELVSLGKVPEPSRPESILGGRIAVDHPTILYGDGGQGKSSIALAIAVGVASGIGFAGLPLPQGAVLYLDYELSQDEQARRAYRISRGLGLSKPPELLHYRQGEKTLLDMMDWLRAWIKKYALRLIIVDSLGLASGSDPESAREIIPLLGAVGALKIPMLLIDHQSKLQDGQNPQNKRPFGSVYKVNLARSVLHVQKIGSEGSRLKVRLRHIKNNFGECCPDLALTMDFEAESTTFQSISAASDPEFSADVGADQRVLEMMRGESALSCEAIATRLRMPPKTAANALTRLKKARKVEMADKTGRTSLWRCVPNPKPL